MNAPVLKRGDVVHMAWPAIPREGDVQGTARRNSSEMTRIYAEYGVEVRMTTIISGLDRPTIVAVFRNEES